jgi:hypothetical protein
MMKRIRWHISAIQPKSGELRPRAIDLCRSLTYTGLIACGTIKLRRDRMTVAKGDQWERRAGMF